MLKTQHISRGISSKIKSLLKKKLSHQDIFRGISSKQKYLSSRKQLATEAEMLKTTSSKKKSLFK